jgi:hypothetical protein
MRARAWAWVTLALLIALSVEARDPGAARSPNLVLVTFDGVRVEEMFAGLDAAVLQHVLGAKRLRLEDSDVYRRFWAPTREERRRRLMPFLWGTLLAGHGWIAGDRENGSHVRLVNAHRLSYPGYSELLTGHAHDDVIVDNARVRSPYPSVLERIQRELHLTRHEVAVFASWDTIGLVAESRPGSLFVNAGPAAYDHPDPVVRRLSEMQFDTPTPWEHVRPDAYTFEFAMAHLRAHHPRVLYIALDETDDLAHDGRYEAVLEALHRYDRWLERLWTTLQTDSFYRGHTSLVITVDHGRGHDPTGWRAHGRGIDGSEDVWVAVVDPTDARRGSQGAGRVHTHRQLAPTLARLMGAARSAQDGGGEAEEDEETETVGGESQEHARSVGGVSSAPM